MNIRPQQQTNLSHTRGKKNSSPSYVHIKVHLRLCQNENKNINPRKWHHPALLRRKVYSTIYHLILFEFFNVETYNVFSYSMPRPTRHAKTKSSQQFFWDVEKKMRNIRSYVYCSLYRAKMRKYTRK